MTPTDHAVSVVAAMRTAFPTSRHAETVLDAVVQRLGAAAVLVSAQGRASGYDLASPSTRKRSRLISRTFSVRWIAAMPLIDSNQVGVINDEKAVYLPVAEGALRNFPMGSTVRIGVGHKALRARVNGHGHLCGPNVKGERGFLSVGAIGDWPTFRDAIRVVLAADESVAVEPDLA